MAATTTNMEGIVVFFRSFYPARPIPPTTTMLIFKEIDNLVALPDLSHLTKLSQLIISSNRNMHYLFGTADTDAKLPYTLRSLKIQNMDALEALPTELPPNLLTLTVGRCPRLTTLPSLPDSLDILNITDMAALQSLPSWIPENLSELNCRFCHNITVLPHLAHTKLIELDLTGNSKLAELPPLPDSLQYLSVTDTPFAAYYESVKPIVEAALGAPFTVQKYIQWRKGNPDKAIWEANLQGRIAAMKAAAGRRRGTATAFYETVRRIREKPNSPTAAPILGPTTVMPFYKSPDTVTPIVPPTRPVVGTAVPNLPKWTGWVMNPRKGGRRATRKHHKNIRKHQKRTRTHKSRKQH